MAYDLTYEKRVAIAQYLIQGTAPPAATGIASVELYNADNVLMVTFDSLDITQNFNSETLSVQYSITDSGSVAAIGTPNYAIVKNAGGTEQGIVPVTDLTITPATLSTIGQTVDLTFIWST